MARTGVKTVKNSNLYILFSANGNLLFDYAPATGYTDYVYLKDKLLAQRGTNTLSYHTDVLGSPVAATNAGGALAWRENFQPYGRKLLNQGNNSNKLWFTGKSHDEDSGLSYFGARYYDPLLGRFMGIDPQDFDETNVHSFNRYAYGNNNPYMYKDPDGEAVETLLDVVSLGLSIAAFKSDPTLLNGLGVAYDALATATPFLPAGFGIIKNAGRTLDALGGAAGTVKTAERVGDAARDAISAANAVRLEKQLASQAQMGEVGTVMAGTGARVPFRDAQRVAQQYGGNASDWVKKTSSSYLSRDGTRFETHWVENTRTGQRVEFKTKFSGGD